MAITRILVIDDEQIVLDSVSRILGAAGIEIVSTTDSREGLTLGTREAFDLVLTDIRMPEIGGMRILRDVKRAHPATPVVIFTGYATVQSAVEAMKLGAADYVEKPFSPDSLTETVMGALEHASGSEPESQDLIHREAVLSVLTRASTDDHFSSELLYRGAEALADFDLTGPEKLAILTGDIGWIESYTGTLDQSQRIWLEQRLNAEIW